MNYSNNNKRKPNYKKWICPIDRKPVNSRGAASYLRIKFAINWDHRYMNNPELICNNTEYHSNDKLHRQLIAILSDYKFEDLKLRDTVLEELYKFHFRVGIAAKNKKRMKQIMDAIYPVTSSKIRIIPKNKHAS
jgi:hypothetical protein